MPASTFKLDNAHCLGQRGLPEIDLWLGGDDDRCVVAKQNSKRTVYAISPEPGAPPTVFLKHDHPQGPRDRSKQIIRPKVRYEYRHTKALFELGIPVIKPLFAAWNVIEGVFVSEALAGSVDAFALWMELRDDPIRRSRFVSGIQRMISAMFQANIYHPDFHLGNLLCIEADDAIDFYLVDCFGVQRQRSLSTNKRNIMLLIAFQLSGALKETELQEFLSGIPELAEEPDIAALLRRLRTLSCESFYKKWPKRKRKLMRSSGFADHHSTNDGEWRINRASALELNRRIVIEHQRIRDVQSDALLKTSRKRCVTAPVVDGKSYVVKEFFNPGPWGSRSADARCWLNNWGLTFCGLPNPPALAWHRDTDNHGYVVTEFVGGISAFDAMMEVVDDDAAFDALAALVYELVRQLYHSRIVHNDLKLNNLLTSDGTVWLIDNDSVHFNVRITQKHWDKNLKHLVRSGEHPVFQKLMAYFSNHPLPYE